MGCVSCCESLWVLLGCREMDNKGYPVSCPWETVVNAGRHSHCHPDTVQTSTRRLQISLTIALLFEVDAQVTCVPLDLSSLGPCRWVYEYPCLYSGIVCSGWRTVNTPVDKIRNLKSALRTGAGSLQNLHGNDIAGILPSTFQEVSTCSSLLPLFRIRSLTISLSKNNLHPSPPPSPHPYSNPVHSEDAGTPGGESASKSPATPAV